MESRRAKIKISDEIGKEKNRKDRRRNNLIYSIVKQYYNTCKIQYDTILLSRLKSIIVSKQQN